jgi:hypothetical protein
MRLHCSFPSFFFFFVVFFVFLFRSDEIGVCLFSSERLKPACDLLLALRWVTDDLSKGMDKLSPPTVAKLARLRERFGRRTNDAVSIVKRKDEPSLLMEEPASKRQHVDEEKLSVVEEEEKLEPVRKVAKGGEFKIVADTPFVVDGFRVKESDLPRDCTFFLTHFHSDHYGGITKNWRFVFGMCLWLWFFDRIGFVSKRYPIYCTWVTGQLLVEVIGVDRNLIRVLMLNETVFVQNIKVLSLEMENFFCIFLSEFFRFGN